MVERKVCSFCGREMEPGTGSLFIRKDGSTFQYCSSKCRKNSLHLGRVPRRVRWTQQYANLKAAGKSKEARAPAKDKERALVEAKKPVEPAKAPEKPRPIAPQPRAVTSQQKPASPQPRPQPKSDKPVPKIVRPVAKPAIAEKPAAAEGAKPKPKKKEA
jgi:large subunit ribosomal protein L24e